MTDMITTQALQRRLDTRTKPQGSLGALEALAIQLGSVLQTETPVLRSPSMFVFAADHGIAADGVSAFPQAVTAQMLENYRNEGAAINVLSNQHGLDLTVIDAGVIPQQRAQRAAAELDRARHAQLPLRAGDERGAMHARDRNRPHVRDGCNRARLERTAARRDGNRQYRVCRDAAASSHRAGRSQIASGAAPGIDDAALERKRQLLAESSARCPAGLVAVRNAGGIRRLRAGDDHRRDARSRTPSLHRGRRRLRCERRGAAGDGNGRARARALRLQPLLGGDTGIASCSNICKHNRCSICACGSAKDRALRWRGR